MYCTPVAIESVTKKVGSEQKSLEVPKSTCSRAMSENTADTVSTLLKGVVEDGTGQEAGLGSRPSAGKTGTTDERFAAWFVGYTPNMAGAVWVGDPQHKRKMTSITIGGVPHDKVYGGEVPGPIWRDMMSGALEDKPVEDFHLIDIPDDSHEDDDRGKATGEERRQQRGHDGTADRRTDRGPDGRGATGGATTGDTTGGTTGGTFPTPTFSIPENFIQGQGNGGNNGNGNGGRG